MSVPCIASGEPNSFTARLETFPSLASLGGVTLLRWPTSLPSHATPGEHGERSPMDRVPPWSPATTVDVWSSKPLT